MPVAFTVQLDVQSAIRGCATAPPPRHLPVPEERRYQKALSCDQSWIYVEEKSPSRSFEPAAVHSIFQLKDEHETVSRF